MIAGLLGAPAACCATGLGVAGGAHLRETGRALVRQAEQLWFWVFLLASAGLVALRPTRRFFAVPVGVYLVALALSYWAGHQWGNFLGWYSD